MASENFLHVNPGINVVPNATTKTAVAGDIDFSLDTNKFNGNNGTLSSPFVLEATSATLTNKTIAAGSNTITGLTNTNLSGSAAITNANLSLMPANTLKGNNTGISALPLDLTVSQVNTMLGTSGAATSIGALDSQAANANGLALVGQVLSSQSADATHPGMVNNTTQTFSGQKTFSTGLTGTLTGNATNVNGVVAIANGGTGQTTTSAAYGALSPMTTTGDMEYESAPGVASRLPIGSANQVLKVSGGIPTWSTFTALTNPMTTTGDIIYSSDNSGTPARLPVGSSGQVLEVVAGIPAWATVSNSSSINYILNPNAEVDTSGWATYSNNPANIPVNGVSPAIIPVTIANTNAVGNIDFLPNASSQWVGQSIVAAANGTITSVTTPLKYTVAPLSGNLVAKVYTDNTGVPGTLLATSSNFNVAALTTSYVNYTFNFIGGPTLAGNTIYHIVFDTTSVVFSGSNFLGFHIDNTAPYTNGSFENSGNSGSTWTVNLADDLVLTVSGTTNYVNIAENFFGVSTLGTSLTTSWIGQSFTATSTQLLSNIILKASYNTSPLSGSFFVGIYTDSAGNPGTLLETSSAFNSASLTTTATNITINFAGTTTLTNSTVYHLVIQPTGVTFTANTLQFQASASNPYAGGQLETSSNSGGTWTQVPGDDLVFAVNGPAITTQIVFSRSTSSPLIGTGSFLISQPNTTNVQGNGVSYDFIIDSAYQANQLNISFNYNASSTFQKSDGITKPNNDGTTGFNNGNSDIEVFIYDITNASLLFVSPEVITNKGANNFQFSGSFNTASNSTSYRLILHCPTSNANATGWNFKFDNIMVGPIVSSLPVAFMAYLAVNQSVTANNPIIFDTVLFDDTNSYSTSTGKFTCPSTGYYEVGGSAFSNGSAFGFYVKRNATSFAYLGVATASVGDSGATIIKASAGDTIEIDIDSGTSVAGNAGPYFTTFTISQIK